MKCPSTYHCPVEATLELIGGKYKALILFHLVEGALRFSELHRLIPQATPKMLTQQLRELETDGLLSRTVYPVIPPKGGVSAHSFWGNDLTGFGGYVQLGIRLFEQIRQQGPFFRGYQYRNAD